MAGNTVSIMAITTKGRGGRVREKHVEDRIFTLHKHQAVFYCGCTTYTVRPPAHLNGKCRSCGGAILQKKKKAERQNMLKNTPPSS